jgi:uncharacterized protein (TIGR02145 family)
VVGGTCSSFKTKKIGEQTWMADNLNCDVEGSKCYGDDPANCAKYGRLYNWATALTVCPSGWHLPDDTEWDVLVNYADSSSVAGAKLKATSGWNYDGNGTNELGFSALPGGYGNSDGGFNGVGIIGFWWSATESGSDYAYFRDMGYGYIGVVRHSSIKSFLFSVRCVQD